jgi:hypothetical protein
VATIEQIEQSLGGKGRKGWQDREQQLRYEEYADNGGNTVRFVYDNRGGGLVWVIAESSLPYPLPTIKFTGTIEELDFSKHFLPD